MKKLERVVASVVVGYFFCWILIGYQFLKPDYSKKECEFIRKNFSQIKLDMSKEEVLSLIGSEPSSKIYPYSGVIFPEQETQWEVWLLCKDLNSCVYVQSLEREQCYEWHMVAFDAETEKVIKVFHDSPDRVGFV